MTHFWTTNLSNKRAWRLALAALLSVLSASVHADIFARHGYQEGRDGVLLMTEKCPQDPSGEFKVAVTRIQGQVLSGCYVINNRGNAVVKWSTGDIAEMRWQLFGSKPLSPTMDKSEATDASGYSAWQYFTNTTQRGTPVCGLYTAGTRSGNTKNISVKQLANRKVLTMTLFNDWWSFPRGSTVPVSVDFADNQPLALSAYADDKVLDIEVPLQATATFLSLLAQRETLRITVAQGTDVWRVPLRGTKQSLGLFLDCARNQPKSKSAD